MKKNGCNVPSKITFMRIEQTFPNNETFCPLLKISGTVWYGNSICHISYRFSEVVPRSGSIMMKLKFH